MTCRLINESGLDIEGSILQKCVRRTAKACGHKDISCSVVLVEAGKMAELNRAHNNKKGPTDVLTFASDEDGYAGDIIICPEFIRDNAGEKGFEWELCHVAVHGTFHLLGIHHEELPGGHEEIHKKEIEIINKVLKLKS